MLTAVTTIIGFAMFVLVFFKELDGAQTSKARTATARWLRTIDPEGDDPRWPTLFLDLFDRVFGPRPLSWRFFRASAVGTLISCSIVALSFLLFGDVLGDALRLSDLYTTLRIAVLIPLLNVVIDYVCVVETRTVLGYMAKRQTGSGKVPFLALDLILNTVIHALFTIAAIATVCKLRSIGLSWVQPDRYAWMCDRAEATRIATGAYVDALLFQQNERPSFTVSFYTTFLTSIWLWLYFISGLLVRAFFHIRRLLGLQIASAHKFKMLEKRPMLILGLISSAIVVTVGLMTVAIAALS